MSPDWTFALGLWAMVAAGLTPFAWGWREAWQAEPGKPAGPAFQPEVLVSLSIWPIVPVFAVVLLALALAVLACEYAVKIVHRWWTSPW